MEMLKDKRSVQKRVITGTNSIKINRSKLITIGIIIAGVLIIPTLLFTISHITIQMATAISNAEPRIDPNNETNNNLSSVQIHTYTSVGPSPVNSYWIQTPKGIIVIDTQRDKPNAERLWQEIQDTGKPIEAIMITHPHPDHYFGTNVLTNGSSNMPIYATQATFDTIKNDPAHLITLAKQLMGKDFPGKIVFPNRIVESGQNVTIDGIKFRFENIGPSEAATETMIYLPFQRILFTGDLINNHMHPLLTGPTFVVSLSQNWIKQINYVVNKYSDAKVLYPAHGPAGSPSTLLNEQLQYLKTFRSLVRQQLQPTGNVSDQGRTIIKNELERIYPGYLPVATVPNMINLNIDAVAKELIMFKEGK
jgi:glyoxylase-like metal-dependent hydrolase (beta-lactamase superfamily II)